MIAAVIIIGARVLFVTDDNPDQTTNKSLEIPVSGRLFNIENSDLVRSAGNYNTVKDGRFNCPGGKLISPHTQNNLDDIYTELQKDDTIKNWSYYIGFKNNKWDDNRVLTTTDVLYNQLVNLPTDQCATMMLYYDTQRRKVRANIGYVDCNSNRGALCAWNFRSGFEIPREKYNPA